MFLSVIIPTCNRNNLLGICLDKLLPNYQTIGVENYEVIVTDDSKENIAKSFLQTNYPWVIWVEGAKRGPAANRNNGAKNAKGSWLVFIDDDCEPDTNWLNEYKIAIEHNIDEVLEGKTVADRAKGSFDEEAPINENGGNLWSCNFAIKKELFFQLNGFDEAFPYPAMEDTDFCVRVKKNNHISFVASAIVIHPWRKINTSNFLHKHIASHKFFAKKYGFYKSKSFRWSRLKIFIGSIVPDIVELYSFNFHGVKGFLYKQALNFLLIIR